MTGSGTLLDPYIIWNVNDLQAVQNDLTAYYELGGNIDASATSGWNGGLGFDPIGTDWNVDPFVGQFDGKGYTISGLFINRPLTNFVGLFAAVTPLIGLGLIKNVKLTNVNITGQARVGALAGTDEASAENCSSTGTVAGDSEVGGLFGYASGGTFTELWSSCVVTGTGGVANDQIGGLLGYLGGVTTQCFATGNVTANNTQNEIGGFCGRADGNISDCYARGDVTGGQYVGGFCGRNSNTIDNAYSTGAPSGTSDVGGFCGWNDAGIITDCFWDTQTSGTAISDGGTGKTTAQMKTQSTFTDAGWDFTTIWSINPTVNDGYPNLGGVTPTPPASATKPAVSTLPATGVT